MSDSFRPSGTLHSQLKNIKSGDTFKVEHSSRIPDDPNWTGDRYDVWYFINSRIHDPNDPGQSLVFAYPSETETKESK